MFSGNPGFGCDSQTILCPAWAVTPGMRVVFDSPVRPSEADVRSVVRTPNGLVELHFDAFHYTSTPGRLIHIR